MRLFTSIVLFTISLPGISNAEISENLLNLHLKNNTCVQIELKPEWAPNHVKRIKELTKEKFYDGIVFHRVMKDFMAQTGDPTGTGAGGSKKPDLKAEFNDTPHARGILSMARSGNPDSANSQFFIVLKSSYFLDNQYTAFGKVLNGMNYVDQIKKGDLNNNGAVTNPDKIISLKLASDEPNVKCE